MENGTLTDCREGSGEDDYDMTEPKTTVYPWLLRDALLLPA